MPDGTITAVLRGRRRFVLDEMLQTDPHLEGKVSMVNEVPPVDKLEFEAMRESILDLSE